MNSMGTSTSHALIAAWKLKLNEVKTRRKNLKKSLLETLENPKDSYEECLRKFNQKRTDLLGPNHHQGVFWPAHQSTFWKYLALLGAWMTRLLGYKDTQAGSNLFFALNEPIIINKKTKKSFKKNLSTLSFEQLYSLRNQLNWSCYLKNLKKQLEDNPSDVSEKLYQKLNEESHNQNPVVVEVHLLASTIMDRLIHSCKELNPKIFSIEKILILLLSHPIHKEDHVNEKKDFFHSFLQTWKNHYFEQDFNLTNVLEKTYQNYYETYQDQLLKHHDKELNKSQTPGDVLKILLKNKIYYSPLITVFAQLASERMLSDYLLDSKASAWEQDGIGWHLFRLIETKLLGRTNAANNHVDIHQTHQPFLTPVSGIHNYFPPNSEEFYQQECHTKKLLYFFAESIKCEQNKAKELLDQEDILSNKSQKWTIFRVGEILKHQKILPNVSSHSLFKQYRKDIQHYISLDNRHEYFCNESN